MQASITAGTYLYGLFQSPENIPTQLQKLTARDSAAGLVQPKTIDALFFAATMDTLRGKVYLKMVNNQATEQPVTINLQGTTKISEMGGNGY